MFVALNIIWSLNYMILMGPNGFEMNAVGTNDVVTFPAA
jgi:hypothetical protein